MSVDRHLVDDLEAAPLPDRGLDLLGFVGPDVVLARIFLTVCRPSVDDRLVVRGAVAAQQVLQDVDRDVRTLLDQLGQVLADDLPGEVPVQQIVQAPAAVGMSGSSEVIVKALSIITGTLCCSMPVSASRSTRR